MPRGGDEDEGQNFRAKADKRHLDEVQKLFENPSLYFAEKNTPRPKQAGAMLNVCGKACGLDHYDLGLIISRDRRFIDRLCAGYQALSATEISMLFENFRPDFSEHKWFTFDTFNEVCTQSLAAQSHRKPKESKAGQSPNTPQTGSFRG